MSDGAYTPEAVVAFYQQRGYSFLALSDHRRVTDLSMLASERFVPLGAMERATGTRTITVPIANHDDNQHTHDENLRIANLWDGIETMAALMEMN